MLQLNCSGTHVLASTQINTRGGAVIATLSAPRLRVGGYSNLKFESAFSTGKASRESLSELGAHQCLDGFRHA